MRWSTIWLERTSWVVGIALVSAYGGMRLWAEESRREAVQDFRIAASSATDQSLWSAQRISAYAQAQHSGEAPKAVLRIPILSLDVPVYGDTSEQNLDRGAGHITGTANFAEPGNIGIAAHRDGFFRKLKDAELGMEVLVELGAHTLRYRIVEISVIAPEEKGVLAPTDRPSLTLVTCYPFYFVGSAPKRYIVRAELDDTRTANHHPHANLPWRTQ